MPKQILRSEARDFLAAVELDGRRQQSVENKDTLQVNEFVGFAAFAYEKLRNLVDYKDDVLLRKNAIKRFLRQRVVLGTVVKDDAVGQDLLRELVLSRYLPNNSVPLKKVDEVVKIITKYRKLQETLRENTALNGDFKKWLMGIEAVEIEHQLVEDNLRHPMTAFAYRILEPLYLEASREKNERTYRRQLVLAIQRILEKADANILAFHLMKHMYADWFGSVEINFNEAAQMFVKYYPEILAEVDHPQSNRFHRLVRRNLVPFLVLRNVMRGEKGEQITNIFFDPDTIKKKAGKSYETYFTELRKKIRRKGLHAMAYIFLTKMVLAILIELPYEQIFLQQVNHLALIINLAFPPLLMLIITIMITTPGPKNTEKLLLGVNEALYEQPLYKFFRQPVVKKSGSHTLATIGFAILSGGTFLLSFGAIVYILNRLDFNLLSGILFVFFVSLVSFFGVSLRQQINNLRVTPGRANIFTFILDIISLPMVWLGRWLSQTFEKINFFVLLLDFFIELPFKVLLKFLDKWFAFLREKKEEIF